MIFSSKTPRDLNHDPKPYVTYANDRRTDVRSAEWDMQSHGEVEYVRSFDPRPEFDHVQHNEPNPILVDFREYARKARSAPWLAAHWTSSDETWMDITTALSGDAPMGTPEQENHARRVLTRLANLTGEN